jgi:Tol biopolymer transport system component
LGLIPSAGGVLGLILFIAWIPCPGQDIKPSNASNGLGAGAEARAGAVARLVDQLKRHPVQRSKVDDPLRLYLIDLSSKEVTLIADEPDPGSNHVGSPRWSHDGRRILYDSMPGVEFQLLHIKVIDIGKDRPMLSDLGPGACPAWSPDDRRIALLLNPGSIHGAEPGIWVMEADGTQRRRAGEFGIPLWSSDDKVFWIVSFTEPRQIRSINLQSGELRPIELPEQKVYSWPTWAGPGTIVATVGDESADSVALLDVSKPGEASIKEVLWRKGAGQEIKPMWPVYSPVTRRCIFVGAEPKGMALYSIEAGKAGQEKRLEAGELDDRIAGLGLSPDGEYLLFCSTRPDRKPR